MSTDNPSKIAFCSSLKDDVWHDVRGPGAFEGWHFDAISDDGEAVLIVEFYDNYVLSPRFYERTHTRDAGAEKAPVVAMAYFAGKQLIVGTVNEFAEQDIAVNDGKFSISGSSLSVVEEPYGKTLVVKVDLATFGGRRVRGEFEWLLIESDLAQLSNGEHDAVWNLVAPRADVTGRLEVVGKLGKTRREVKLRGTGFHDHILSRDVHYKDLRSRVWGRAHFSDATLVFERHGGVQNASEPGRFFVIQNSEITEYHADCHATEHRRTALGLNIPRRVAYLASDGTRVRIKPYAMIRSDLCEAKMLSTVTLTLNDGKTREALGITEFVDPSRLQNNVVRRVSDLRIGKRGRSGFF